MSDFDQEPTGWAAFAGIMMWGIAVFAFTAAIAGLFNNSLIYENSALGQKWDWI